MYLIRFNKVLRDLEGLIDKINALEPQGRKSEGHTEKNRKIKRERPVTKKYMNYNVNSMEIQEIKS